MSEPGFVQAMKTMHAVLRGDVSVTDGAQALGVAEDRLGIYSDFVRGHVTGILDKMYPRVRELTGAAWPELKQAYFRAVPSAHWELNACASGFPEFLDAQVATVDDVEPFHVALAQFEWEEFAVYMAEADVPTAAEVSGLTLNPTLSLLSLPYPVVPFVMAWDEQGAPPADIPERVEGGVVTILFRRGESHRIAFYQPGADMLFAIRVVYEGISVADAAQRTNETEDRVVSALNQAITSGLLIGSATGL